MTGAYDRNSFVRTEPRLTDPCPGRPAAPATRREEAGWRRAGVSLGFVYGTAARLDDLLAGSVGAALRRDLAVPVNQRGGDYVQASFGAWTVLAVLLLTASLFIDAQSWPVSAGVAVVIAAPAGMGVLRGVHDRARARYTTGGLPFVLALALAFFGALAVVQPAG